MFLYMSLPAEKKKKKNYSFKGYSWRVKLSRILRPCNFVHLYFILFLANQKAELATPFLFSTETYIMCSPGNRKYINR